MAGPPSYPKLNGEYRRKTLTHTWKGLGSQIGQNRKHILVNGHGGILSHAHRQCTQGWNRLVFDHPSNSRNVIYALFIRKCNHSSIGKTVKLRYRACAHRNHSKNLDRAVMQVSRYICECGKDFRMRPILACLYKKRGI